MQHKILSSFLIFIISSLVLSYAVFAESPAIEDVSGLEDFASLNIMPEAESVEADNDYLKQDVQQIEELEKKNGEKVNRGEDVCGFEVPENKTYGARVITVRRQLRVDPGEDFRIKAFVKNTGTMSWFSNKSECLGPKVSLGTDKERDHDSLFYEEGLEGWEAANRVGMDQYRTDPGEIASFTFRAKASDDPDIYKVYFAPVVAGIQWIDEGQFSFDVIVGEVEESAVDVRKKLSYANYSGSVSRIDLNAEKLLNVDLSEQKLYVKLGDNVIHEFMISSGAAATPTPVGETSIILKQWVRVGHKPPHYIMPRYMMFRAGGYGFHALPSLGNDGGVFWTEARNHIGIPVSHGCIRILPEDADWLYDFTDVGTKVVVQR